MKNVLVVFAILASVFAFAHGDHHQLDNEQVAMAAKSQVASLVKEKKIDAIWEKAEVISSEMTQIKGKSRWLVIMKNKAQKNDQKLEVVLTPGGKLVSNQVTGK